MSNHSIPVTESPSAGRKLAAPAVSPSIRRLPLEAAQTLAKWRTLLRLSSPKRVPSRSTLFFQTDRPRDVILLAGGIVKVVYDASDGTRSLLGLRYAGQLVLHALPDPEAPYPVSAITLTAADIHRIDLSRILDAERRDPAVLAFQSHTLKQDLRDLAIAHLRSKVLSPAQRMECLLWEIAAASNGIESAHRARLALPLGNGDLAALCGLSYSHCKSVRRQLETAGRLTRLDRRVWTLTRPRSSRSDNEALGSAAVSLQF